MKTEHNNVDRERHLNYLFINHLKHTNIMKLIYQKYQNKNEQSTAYNKWYGRVVINETVGIEQLASRMQDNCTVKRADILAVLSELGPTIRDLLQDSKRVSIPYLGAFKLGITTTGAETPKKFTVKENVKGVHVIFQPETHVTVDGKRVKDLVKDCRLAEDQSYLSPEDEEDENPENNGD